jgi:DNA-binding transcriptional MerR regulator
VSPPARPGPDAAPRDLVSIGEVMNRLRPEFPEITISKIRFLESEGLVEPRRSPSGYRKFAPADVERLRYVLRVQRDRYLPLRVIKDHLDALDRGLEPPALPVGPDVPEPREPAVDAAAADGGLPDGPGPADGAVRLTRAELLAAAGIDDAALTRLEEFGLVEALPVADVPGGVYPADAVLVARVAAALGAYGLEPRHLRPVKVAADREAALVEQIVAPLLRRRDARAKADAEGTLRDLVALTSRLHQALVTASLRPLRHSADARG